VVERCPISVGFTRRVANPAVVAFAFLSSFRFVFILGLADGRYYGVAEASACVELLPRRPVLAVQKRRMIPDRNSLGEELIEALECVKVWWDNRLVERH
jgi:hypothetical protein